MIIIIPAPPLSLFFTEKPAVTINYDLERVMGGERGRWDRAWEWDGTAFERSSSKLVLTNPIQRREALEVVGWVLS